METKEWGQREYTRRTAMAVRFAVSAIGEAKQHWSVIGWATKNLLSRAPPRRHVKPLVPAAFTVVNTHKSTHRLVGYAPFSLWVNYKEGLCSSSGDIDRLMMMVMMEEYLRCLRYTFGNKAWVECKYILASIILGFVPLSSMLFNIFLMTLVLLYSIRYFLRISNKYGSLTKPYLNWIKYFWLWLWHQLFSPN
jgi:hypothetical protein